MTAWSRGRADLVSTLPYFSPPAITASAWGGGEAVGFRLDSRFLRCRHGKFPPPGRAAAQHITGPRPEKKEKEEKAEKGESEEGEKSNIPTADPARE